MSKGMVFLFGFIARVCDAIAETIYLDPEKTQRFNISITSDGTTSEEWCKYFNTGVFTLLKEAEDVLLSPYFKPTRGVTTKVVIVKEKRLKGKDYYLTTENVRNYALRQRLTAPSLEVACLIARAMDKTNMRTMGLSDIVIMCEPIKDNYGYRDSIIYSCNQHNIGCRFLGTHRANPEDLWFNSARFVPGEIGFAFIVSKMQN